jgi:hypothetical protein
MINPWNSDSPWDSNLENRTISYEFGKYQESLAGHKPAGFCPFLFNGFALEGQHLPGLYVDLKETTYQGKKRRFERSKQDHRRMPCD